jgi:hypothetical protein
VSFKPEESFRNAAAPSQTQAVQPGTRTNFAHTPKAQFLLPAGPSAAIDLDTSSNDSCSPFTHSGAQNPDKPHEAPLSESDHDSPPCHRTHSAPAPAFNLHEPALSQENPPDRSMARLRKHREKLALCEGQHHIREETKQKEGVQANKRQEELAREATAKLTREATEKLTREKEEKHTRAEQEKLAMEEEEKRATEENEKNNSKDQGSSILYHTIPYFSLLYYGIILYSIVYCSIIFYAMLCNVILWHTILYLSALHCTIPWS